MKLKLKSNLDVQAFISKVNALTFDKGEVYEAILPTKERKKRTIPQNKLYHLYLNIISKETGNTIADLHDYFREQFLGMEHVVIFGKKVERLISTTSLDTVQFTTYIEQIRAFAATELSITLPDSNDYFIVQYMEQYDY